LLPRDLARNLSNISPLVIVKAINSGITVTDPFTGEVCSTSASCLSSSSPLVLVLVQKQDLNTEKYFRDPFGAVMTSRQLMPFVVLSVEPVLAESRPTARKRGVDRKMRLAEIVVARERDFGVNDTQFTVLSHLGHLLREGDLVQGYDMTSATWTGDELERYKDSLKGDLPDVILVRKVANQPSLSSPH
jgi:nonsense-mediated mRNA decay protein 3